MAREVIQHWSVPKLPAYPFVYGWLVADAPRLTATGVLWKADLCCSCVKRTILFHLHSLSVVPFLLTTPIIHISTFDHRLTMSSTYTPSSASSVTLVEGRNPYLQPDDKKPRESWYTSISPGPDTTRKLGAAQPQRSNPDHQMPKRWDDVRELFTDIIPIAEHDFMLGMYFIIGQKMGLNVDRFLPRLSPARELVAEPISAALLHLHNYIDGSRAKQCDVNEWLEIFREKLLRPLRAI